MSLENEIRSLTNEIGELRREVKALSVVLQQARQERPSEEQYDASPLVSEAAPAEAKETPVSGDSAEAPKEPEVKPESTEGLYRAPAQEAPAPAHEPTASEITGARVARQKICTQYFVLLQDKEHMPEADARLACKDLVAEFCAGKGKSVNDIPHERHDEFMAFIAAKIKELENA